MIGLEYVGYDPYALVDVPSLRKTVTTGLAAQAQEIPGRDKQRDEEDKTAHIVGGRRR